MLTGRLLTSDHQEFILAEWDGVNRSGYEPLDDKVLVLIDTHAEVTSGGISIPAEIVQRQTMAAEHGVVVAIGPAAFRWNDDGTRAWDGRRPEPGDRVYIERYSGQLLNGRDGRRYRLMSQKCIGAIAVAPERDFSHEAEQPSWGLPKSSAIAVPDAEPPTSKEVLSEAEIAAVLAHLHRASCI